MTKEALKEAGQMVVELLRQGRLVEAAEVLFDRAFAPLFDLVRRNAEQIAELDARLSAKIDEVHSKLSAKIEEIDARLSARIDEVNAKLSARINEVDTKLSARIEEVDTRLSARIEEVDARLGRRLEQLAESVSKLVGEVGRLRGWETEIKVGRMLTDWFRRKAPEYDVIWWTGQGADLLVEGRGLLAAIDITSVPKAEDVWQLKRGVGAIRAGWGKTPDVLVIYSHSGVVPDDVAKLADELGVKVVRGPLELKAVLDEVAAQVGRKSNT